MISLIITQITLISLDFHKGGTQNQTKSNHGNLSSNLIDYLITFLTHWDSRVGYDVESEGRRIHNDGLSRHLLPQWQITSQLRSFQTQIPSPIMACRLQQASGIVLGGQTSIG
jgi:hypothetical protein